MRLPPYETRHMEHLALIAPDMLREMKADGSLEAYLVGVAEQAREAEHQTRMRGADWTAIEDVVASILNPPPM